MNRITSAWQWCWKAICSATSKSLGVASRLCTFALSKVKAGWKASNQWLHKTAWPWAKTQSLRPYNWFCMTALPWIKAKCRGFPIWWRTTVWPKIKRKLKAKTSNPKTNMKDKLNKWAPRILIALLLLRSYYEAWKDSTWIKSLFLTVIVGLVWFAIRMIKIWLCKTERCGIMVKPKHFRMVTKGGHAYTWALSSGLKLVTTAKDGNGKRITVDTKSISGRLLETKEPATHPGAEFGAYWVGWLAPFLGYAFPIPSIERVSKEPGADPKKPIAEQYTRDTKKLTEGFRAYVNRFVIVINAELNDGSRVTLALYATNGFVRYPERFAINQAADQFAIWESAASSSLSSFLRGYSFDQLFREDRTNSPIKAYEIIRVHMESDEAITRAQETIGVVNVKWHMEGWEDNSPEVIIKKRQKLAEDLAGQVAETRRAKAGIRTAAAQTAEKRAQQHTASAEYTRRLNLLGITDPAHVNNLSDDTRNLLDQVLLASDAGGVNQEIVKGFQAVLERQATPGLRTLVDAGADTPVQLQVRDGGES